MILSWTHDQLIWKGPLKVIDMNVAPSAFIIEYVHFGDLIIQSIIGCKFQEPLFLLTFLKLCLL